MDLWYTEISYKCQLINGIIKIDILYLNFIILIIFLKLIYLMFCLKIFYKFSIGIKEYIIL